ncbi:phosphotransferase [Amycolatopsis sp. NPDC059021]|uniref:phosphotransferase n=1 Tax=Amycolatopsis sp. NPDC059021 TaxID=3346704 RepID=UPI0036711061
MKVPAELARSIRTRWPDRADQWLTAIEPELADLCRRHNATPRRILPARYALVVAATTPEQRLILRATPDPGASAQTTVAKALADIDVGPAIHEAVTTESGTWTIMDQVTPGTPLADADPTTVTLDELTAPLRAIAAAPDLADDLPHLADWLRRRLTDDHLTDLAPGLTVAPSSERKQALELLDGLSTETASGLCHADVSPWNVLRDSDGNWSLIDPRGLRGQVEYDAAVMSLKISSAIPSISNVNTLIADSAKFSRDRVSDWEKVARAARV